MENNKIKKDINNVVNDNLKALEQLFPSAVKDGQLDVKALKEELGDFEEVGNEKYELNWSGKQNAKKMVQQGIGNKTLKFVEKDSKNADSTENIYIEGDNLEVLKLLRQNYYNSIKMIYIDPPYNTGNDFVYNDTFKMDKEESDKAEGIISENNEKLQKNQKSTNRYHANWLNMMYPRLKLARDLLTDDGVIFISIDDNEQANLKRLCDEIFGEENFVGELPTIMNLKGNNDEFGFSGTHEFTIVYAREKNFLELNNFPINEEELEDWEEDEFGKYKRGANLKSTGINAPREKRPNLFFPIYIDDNDDIFVTEDNNKPQKFNGNLITLYPITDEQEMSWRWSKSKFKNELENIIVSRSKNVNIYKKQRPMLGDLPSKKPKTLFYKPEYSSGNGTIQIKSLFNKKLFSNPKPIELLKDFIILGGNKNLIILDFFSGSATTAHAVMQLNSEDNGNRKYIMVQLPETTDEKSEAFKAGYKNIAEIGKERIRRAGEKIKQEIEEYNSNLKLGEEPKKVPDIGFKVFKVDDTNIKWYDLENFNEESQYSFDDPDSLDFVLGSNDIDIVYEIILRQNDVPLSENLEVLTDIGNRTYLYASTYLICLETEITEQMVEKLASLEPLPIKFVFRDSAFKDNISLKDETFRKLRSLIERNSGESKVSYRVEFI